MDIEAFKGDLRKSVGMLPKSAIEKLGEVLTYALNNMDELSAAFPQMIPVMQNHVFALAFEFKAGMLDTAELETAVREVFTEFGINPNGG